MLNYNKQGFYLSQDGLSIITNFINSTEGILSIEHENSTLAEWKIKEVFVKDEATGGEALEKCIVSTDNSGIYMDSKFSAIILWSNSGKIYSGEHYTLDSIIPDFYLSQNGLSITGFDETENVVSTIKLDITSTPTISSNKNSLLSTNQGFYLGYDGLSIGANFIILSSGIATISQQGSKVGGWDLIGVGNDQKLQAQVVEFY